MEARQWGYHRRSLAENAMYQFKTLTGNCLWARHIEAQATEVAVRVGVINPAWLTSLVRYPFVSPESMPVDAIASSHSIYATTPLYAKA